MALSNDKITTTLVANTLGTSSRDVGTLCTHTAINKWSKWKPVNYPIYTGITSTILENIKYGLSGYEYPTLQSLVNTYAKTSTLHPYPIWNYNKPVGVDILDSPFRLGDFRNYEHKAVNPVGIYNVTSRITQTGSNSLLTGNIGVTTGNNSYMINYDELRNNYVFSMAITGSKTYNDPIEGAVLIPNNTILRSTAALTDDGTQVRMITSNLSLSVGNYFAIFYLAPTSGATTNVIGIEGFPKYGLPFEVVSSVLNVSIIARYDEVNTNKIIWQVRCNNDTGSAVDLTNCVLAIRLHQNECGSTLEEFEWQTGLGTVVAPVGDNIIYEDFREVIRMDNNGSELVYKLCWSNGGMYPNQFATDILTPMT